MLARLAWSALACSSLPLAACAALFGTSLTPLEQACMQRSMDNVPDLSGTWQTNTGERLVLVPDPGRKTTVRAQFAADSKKPNPNWFIEVLYLQWPRNPTPQSEECGPNWTVTVRQTFPDRKPGGPGQFVSLTDNRTATLSTSFDGISFGGEEVWTRVGAVASELQVPKPGDLAQGMAMEGPTLARAPGSREIDCVAQCRSNPRCAAMVFRGDVCTTLSQLGRVTAAGGTSTWINPGFDSRPPPPLPGPGQQVSHIRLSGEPFKTVGLGDRAGPWACVRACEEDWTCRAYTFESWEGKCELLRKATSAAYAQGWVSGAMLEPTAQIPEYGSHARDTRLTGATRRSMSFGKEQKSAVGHECVKACQADEGCKAVSYGPNAECELKGAALGDAQPAKGWTSWRAPLPPPDTSRPPDQTMTSPLCQSHGDAFPARFLTTDFLPPKGDYAPRFVEVPGLVPNGWGPSPTGDVAVRHPPRPEPKTWSMGFYPRPLPDGTVHFHTFYQPDVVLKRKDGDIIAGAPDQHSAWRIEHLFEHADPPEYGVWYVIRSPDTGMFLAARGERLVLVGSPDSPEARWRFDFAVLPAEQGREFIDISVKEPPRLILDQGALNRLTDWAVKEYYRQEQPACWKKGGSGDCPPGQDTNCGLFCAKSTAMCVMEVTEMVVSVGELAANIAGAMFTGGAANVALRAARTAGAGAKLGMRQLMRTAGRALRGKLQDRLGARVIRFIKSRGTSESFKKLSRDVAKKTAIQTGRLTAREAMSGAAEAYLDREQARHADNLAEAYAQEVSRMAAEKIALQAAAGDNPDWLAIAATVDPTGVMAVVDAYYKPMCEETPMPDVTF